MSDRRESGSPGSTRSVWQAAAARAGFSFSGRRANSIAACRGEGGLALFCRGACRLAEIRGARNTKGGNEFSHRASSAGIALVLDLVPEFGRIVAALAPSTKEKLLEFVDARRSSMRRRPFRVSPGAQETPDGLSLNMQRETDGLLTHTLTVQANYFVIPINPALATVLTILRDPALGLRRTVSWRRVSVPASRAQLLSPGRCASAPEPARRRRSDCNVCGPEYWADLIMYDQQKFPPHA